MIVTQATIDAVTELMGDCFKMNRHWDRLVSVLGMTPPDFEQSLAEGHAGSMVDKLTMLLNANTMKDGGTGGRPRQDASQLTDSGEQSREGLE